MSNIAILSLFRNAAHNLDLYIQQIEDLNYLPEKLRVVCVEGDSDDDTRERLVDWAARDERVSVLQHDTGTPHYGSVINAERFAVLAAISNIGLDYIMADDWADYVLTLPSDVMIGDDLILRLLAHKKPLIAAMFWDHTGRFYDVWGFTQNGGQRLPPYNHSWYAVHFGDEPVEMDSVGGSFLMAAEVLRAGARYSLEDVDHGLCRDAREAGFGVWCDPLTHIVHRDEQNRK